MDAQGGTVCVCGPVWLSDCIHFNQNMMWVILAQLRLSGYSSALMNMVM